MTPEQIQLVKTSFAKVGPISETAADLFYGRLFTVAPGVRPLFKADMKTQGRMLMATIGLVVRSLDHPEQILEMVRKLGERHVDYGAKPEHYPVVGECLIWTLQQGLGEEFTPAHETAWLAAYGLLSGLMIDAQNAATSHRAA